MIILSCQVLQVLSEGYRAIIEDGRLGVVINSIVSDLFIYDLI